jgi:hypothetical protein
MNKLAKLAIILAMNGFNLNAMLISRVPIQNMHNVQLAGLRAQVISRYLKLKRLSTEY